MTFKGISWRILLSSLLVSAIAILMVFEIGLQNALSEEPSTFILSSMPLILFLLVMRFAENSARLILTSLYISLAISSAFSFLSHKISTINQLLILTLVTICVVCFGLFLVRLLTEFWSSTLRIGFPLGSIIRGYSGIFYHRERDRILSLVIGFLTSFMLAPLSLMYEVKFLSYNLSLGLLIFQSLTLSFSSIDFLLTATISSLVLLSLHVFMRVRPYPPYPASCGLLLGTPIALAIEAFLQWRKEGMRIPERSSLVLYSSLIGVSSVAIFLAVSEPWIGKIHLRPISIMLTLVYATVLSFIMSRIEVEVYPIWRYEPRIGPWGLGYSLIWLMGLFAGYSEIRSSLMTYLVIIIALIPGSLFNGIFISHEDERESAFWIGLVSASFSLIMSAVLSYLRLSGVYTLTAFSVKPSRMISLSVPPQYLALAAIPLMISLARIKFPRWPFDPSAPLLVSLLPSYAFLIMLLALIFKFISRKLKEDDALKFHSFIIGLASSWPLAMSLARSLAGLS